MKFSLRPTPKDPKGQEKEQNQHSEGKGHINFLFEDIPESNDDKESRKFSLFPYFRDDYNYMFSNILLQAIFFLNFAVTIVSQNLYISFPEALEEWGANYPFTTMAGDFWRLITANFIQYNLGQLVVVCFALLHILGTLQYLMGKSRMIMVFLCSGLVGNIIAMYSLDYNVYTGTYFAIFGLYGSLVYLVVKGRMSIRTHSTPIVNALLFTIYSLIFVINWYELSIIPFIMSFLCGILLTYALQVWSHQYGSKKSISYLYQLTAGICAAAYIIGYFSLNPSYSGTGKLVIRWQKDIETTSHIMTAAKYNDMIRRPQIYGQALSLWKNFDYESERTFKATIRLKDYPLYKMINTYSNYNQLIFKRIIDSIPDYADPYISKQVKEIVWQRDSLRHQIYKRLGGQWRVYLYKEKGNYKK